MRFSRWKYVDVTKGFEDIIDNILNYEDWKERIIDPVNENGKDILDYNYYLITTKKLKEIDNSKSHRFNKDFYLELKES